MSERLGRQLTAAHHVPGMHECSRVPPQVLQYLSPEEVLRAAQRHHRRDDLQLFGSCTITPLRSDQDLRVQKQSLLMTSQSFLRREQAAVRSRFHSIMSSWKRRLAKHLMRSIRTSLWLLRLRPCVSLN